MGTSKVQLFVGGTETDRPVRACDAAQSIYNALATFGKKKWDLDWAQSVDLEYDFHLTFAVLKDADECGFAMSSVHSSSSKGGSSPLTMPPCFSTTAFTM